MRWRNIFLSKSALKHFGLSDFLSIWSRVIVKAFSSSFFSSRIFCRYKVTILLLTFMSYTCFHLSRKAISVVKPVLIDCPEENKTNSEVDPICTSFISKPSLFFPAFSFNPFTWKKYFSFPAQINGTAEAEAKTLLSTLDTSFLVSYAIFMFFRYTIVPGGQSMDSWILLPFKVSKWLLFWPDFKFNV